MYGIFYRLLNCSVIENVWESWPIKIDFGWPNAEIGWKMAKGWLLFLALHTDPSCHMYLNGTQYECYIYVTITCMLHFMDVTCMENSQIPACYIKYACT